MDAITNRRTTPASRARVVVDAGRDGGRLDDARISLASRAATSKRAMRENYQESLSTDAVLAARAETSEGVDDANARRASRGDAVSRRACSRLISNPAPRPVRASDPPPL